MTNRTHCLSVFLFCLLALAWSASCSNSSGSWETQPDTDQLDESSDLQETSQDSNSGDSRYRQETLEELESDVPSVCGNPVPEHVLDDRYDDTFDLGPYLMVPTPNSINIKWRTLEESDGAVLYGVGDETNLEAGEEGVHRVHSVVLEGLMADTRYAYRVKSGGVTGQLHHFRTAPEIGSPFRFTAWGDSQGGTSFPDIAQGMLQQNPDIVLGLGDLVHDGRIYELWKDHLFEPARALFHEVALFAAFGNHGKNGDGYYELMGYENLSARPEWESVYSYTYGNTFFLVVDTNGLFFSIGDVDTDWSAWIKAQVDSPAARNATWRIAYAHEPGASQDVSVAAECGGYFNTVNSGVNVWLLPLLQEYNFHAYLCGHVHIYERTMVGNLLHVIGAGGGGGLEMCETESTVSVKANRYHFLKGIVGCDSLRLEAVDLDGEVFDFVELGAGTPGQILDQGPFPANL